MPRTLERKQQVVAGAVPADSLESTFPRIDLPIRPPLEPIDATSVEELPTGRNWQYEPKWDGFRCLVFKKSDEVLMQSKSGQRLDRYFPELVEAFRRVSKPQFVLDGEIVIEVDGSLSFDQLLLRIHPAESRVRKLAAQAPATLLAFDILVDDKGRDLTRESLEDRRHRLETFFSRMNGTALRLSPASVELRTAQAWMKKLVGHGLDGVMAKRLDASYVPGDRTSMVKVKPQRTADCVVGGFRYDQTGSHVASLLLGLYDEQGLLDHVGFSSSFSREQRVKLKEVVEPLKGGAGFTGRAPGGPSRWSRRTSNEWERLRPELVCEVAFDHFSGGRFRHGTTFLRWRPDKRPAACTFSQVMPSRWAGGLDKLLAATE